MAKIEISDVTKVYPGKVLAVKNANLVIEDNEFLVLVGPSGCGKTTILRMIAGLEDITEGTISIDGNIVNDVPPKDRNIAMVFQNYALYPHMTVFDNMAFSLQLRKYPNREIKSRVEEVAKILGISHQLYKKPSQISGGERQRVALGRAIVRNPKVFLFDEPLSNLDAKLRVEMRAELKALHNRLKTTMIYVTHDQLEAMTLGDRVAVLKDGEIQQVATPINLFNYPLNKFVAGFIGTPAMNFLTGKITFRDKSFCFNFNGSLVKLSQSFTKYIANYVDKDVILGIRPQDLYNKKYYSAAVTENVIYGKVDIVEPVGTEAFVYLSNNNQKFIMRSGFSEKTKIGENVEVVCDISKAHIFDTISLKNITLVN